MPFSLLLDSSHIHNSLVFVEHKSIAPALRIWLTTSESFGARKSLRAMRPVVFVILMIKTNYQANC